MGVYFHILHFLHILLSILSRVPELTESSRRAQYYHRVTCRYIPLVIIHLVVCLVYIYLSEVSSPCLSVEDAVEEAVEASLRIFQALVTCNACFKLPCTRLSA